MGSSLHTNQAAMTALRTLQTISREMEITQNRISTGREINEASDDTAYWSITNSMRSDREVTDVVKKSLEMGYNRVDQASKVVTQISKEIEKIKKSLLACIGLNASDQELQQNVIEKATENIKTALSSASLNGSTNFLTDVPMEPHVEGKPYVVLKHEIPALFRRDGNEMRVENIEIDPKDVLLYGQSPSEKDPTKLVPSGILAGLLSPNTTKIMDFSIHISTKGKLLAYSADELKERLNLIEKMQKGLAKVDTALGAAKTQIGSQKEFVSSLIDNLDKSVGALVDADMNAESARLSALQVQESLATKALSIANNSTQNLLTLYSKF